jgi:hypothetical protein
VAARLGRSDIVAELLTQGADPERCDTAGRTALRVAIASWLDQRELKPTDFEAVFARLATAPIKVKVGSRMAKLDPSSMEWLLLNLCLVQYRRMVADALQHQWLPAFKAPALANLLGLFPRGVVPTNRKRRAYVSSILSKNEVMGNSPYNRRLFFRAAHGYYVLNPALDIEVRGTWVNVADLMGLPVLLDTLGSQVEYLRRWMDALRDQLERRTAGAGEAPAVASESRAC